MIKSICIVRLSALGDVLMLVPLIRTLQANYPQARLTWIIAQPAYALVEGMSDIEFILIDKPSGLADYWHFARTMSSRHFDVLLATQASFRANLLYPLIRAKRKIGYDRLRAKDGHGWFVKETIPPGNDHTLDGFMKFAETLGINHRVISWDLPISDDDYDWAKQHLPLDRKKPIILVNPAASKPERSWLIERYIAVIRYLQQRWQAQVILVGGPGEFDKSLANHIVNEVEVLNLVGKTRPKQLLAMIDSADLLICPDTGPAHMASAVSTPVVALHAVTSSDVSGPYIYRHLAVDFYSQARETILGKTAENNVWGTHAHGTDTMALITVDAVIAKLEQVLSQVKSR